TAFPFSADAFLQKGLSCKQVFHLLRAGNLALDSDRALVFQFFQSGDDSRKVHFALADRYFFSKLFWICRPKAVFGVNSLNVWGENFDGVYWIGFAVKNQIGGGEFDALIVGTVVLDCANYRDALSL